MVTRCDAAALLAALEAATARLEANVDEVNALNVYPVPDGDTGTNMLHTMKTALEHARKADAVVRAHVIGFAHVPKEGPPKEHDPDWWIAELEIDLLVRGKLPAGTNAGQTIHVLYANSLDVSWRQSPKPKAGQSGLWLLHRAPRELAGLAPFELVHPIDLQPSLQLEVLRERGLASEAPEEEEEQAGADA